MLLLLVLSLGALAYVSFGYLLILRLLVHVRGPRLIKHADVTPSMTLVISAYNEAVVMRRKLENVLAIDYPAGKLEIAVISDASSDGTDAIVAAFEDRGVKLFRQEQRKGKTAGLNAVLPLLTGEVVAFSDANAMYKPDALRKLARNFADPQVGCVTGEARYLPGADAAADVGERAYWNYEMQIKRLETAVGSMVGGDGAIYAIRRTLWRELPDNAINDFLNPLQIVAAGWRAVYEPEAICFEETAGNVKSEYRRRVRIVSRSWRAIFQAPGVLNPFRVGLFAWCLISHKLLRWFTGVFAAIAGVSVTVEAVTRWPEISLASLGVVAVVAAATRTGRRTIAMLAYFTAVNTASAVGLFKGSLGRVSGVWSTPREHGMPGGEVAAGPTLRVGRLLVLAGAALLAAGWGSGAFRSMEGLAALIFWGSVAILTYVYVGYPLMLACIRPILRRPVRSGAIEPTVCLFIAANDEGAIIEAKLQNALALQYPPGLVDIVVASDGSLDATNAIVRRFSPRVRLLEFTPRCGKMSAINRGMQSVTSDIVVFSDANTFLEPGAVRALVRNFSDPDVGAVSGDVALIGDRAALAKSEDLYYLYERWIQRAESQIGSTIGADGALYAIRRELFMAPPADTILDDMAIPMAVIRAGRRVVFERAARAFEHGSETATQEFSRKTRVIAGAMQFLRRRASDVPLKAPQVLLSLLSHKALRWLSPAFAACAFASSLVLAGTAPVYTAAVGAELVFLFLGIAGCAPPLRRVSFIAIAHYFCLMQAAAAVGFLRGVTNRQSVLWHRFERASSPPRIAYTND